MLNITGSPRLSNCIFRNNRAFSGGAGMYNGEDSDPLLEACNFIENVTTEDGAGMLNYVGSDPVLIGCDFIRNKAGKLLTMISGYAILMDYYSPLYITT